MSRLLATIAPIAPPGEAFQIHQVVNKFQINRFSKSSQKNRRVFAIVASIQNNGTKAINIKKVKGLTGHAAYNSKPGNTSRKLFLNDFTPAR